MDRTDQKHIKEIILVDDYSDLDNLNHDVQEAVDKLNNVIKKEEEMIETNNIDMENVVDYINDDNYDKKSTENSEVKNNVFNIRLLKTSKREGLIRARLYGADNSVGDVCI